MVVAHFRGEEVVRVPAESVSGGSPAYNPPAQEPEYIKQLASLNPLDLEPVKDFNKALINLLSSPDIASKEWVWRRYDYQVRTCTVQGPGGDAAVIRHRESGKALAMAVDGNGRYVYLNPYLGGMLAVAEATRNVSCVGAEPIGITDCLNFGNPEKPEIYWQFSQAVAGMAEACKKLEVPVVGGNVSFYNEVEGEAIYPTPVVGAVGLLENYEQQAKIEFVAEGDIICLLGAKTVSLGGSQFLKTAHGQLFGELAKLDLILEKGVQDLLRQLISRQLLQSVHDLSDGGLSVALAESCLAGNKGASVDIECSARPELELFGEGPSRVLISVNPDKIDQVKSITDRAGIALQEIGLVQGDLMKITAGGNVLVELKLAQMEKAYGEVFTWIME